MDAIADALGVTVEELKQSDTPVIVPLSAFDEETQRAVIRRQGGKCASYGCSLDAEDAR